MLLAAGAALADNESTVRLDQKVSDRDFHRAVACSARPGGRCRDTLAAWPAPQRRDLAVAFRSMEGASSGPRRAVLQQALNRAIREINGAGAGIRLRRADSAGDPAITVWDSAFTDGERYDLPEEDLRDDVMEGARVHIWWDGDHRITRGVILIAADLDLDDINSVMLEELVQSLGLLTDIEGDYYSTTSIFSQDSNAVTRLRGQDAAALRLHYPED